MASFDPFLASFDPFLASFDPILWGTTKQYINRESMKKQEKWLK